MPKYLIEANYVGEGWKGLIKDGGTGRRAAIEAVVKSVGGTVDALYYAFGKTDVFLLMDVPDNTTAAALALTVGASGVVTTKITVLLTPEEVDAAAKKTPTYRAPGK